MRIESRYLLLEFSYDKLSAMAQGAYFLNLPKDMSASDITNSTIAINENAFSEHQTVNIKNSPQSVQLISSDSFSLIIC